MGCVRDADERRASVVPCNCGQQLMPIDKGTTRMTKLTTATCLAALALWVAPMGAQAQTLLAQDKVVVLACLENMENGTENATTWNQCTTLMFQPCAEEEVGLAGHVACLKAERTGWQASLETLQAKVFEAITVQASGELSDLLEGWTKFVGQKCQEVAMQRAGTGADAAQVGCEIAEMVGLSSEYAACLEGRSTAPFCKIEQ